MKCPKCNGKAKPIQKYNGVSLYYCKKCKEGFIAKSPK